MLRLCGKVLGVVAVGIGTGILVWGTSTAALGETIRSPIDFLDIGFVIASPGEAIGWGAGFLAGGIATLFVSCVGD